MIEGVNVSPRRKIARRDDVIGSRYIKKPTRDTSIFETPHCHIENARTEENTAVKRTPIKNLGLEK